MIERNLYLQKLINAQNNGFAKIITGIRRCGKSYLLENIFRDYLLRIGVRKDDIIIIDLDETENYRLHDPLVLSEYIANLTKDKTMAYVIIDEIQNVAPIFNPVFKDGKHIKAKYNEENIITFANVILSLSKKHNIDLYVTGSNSKMLSNDVQTEFRGKATNINVSPLSFEEFVTYKKEDEFKSFNDYLVYGGMPLTVLKNNDEEKREYLKSLFETTYFKDIIERYKFRKNEALDELATLLSSCVGNLINSEKLANTFRQKTKNKIDPETISSYINAFVDSHIISEVNRYDVKGKNIIGSLKKYYFVDNGLRNARTDFVFSDEGQMVENVVYNELIYNGYSVNVGTYDNIGKDNYGHSVRNTYEIDFLAKKGTRFYYIQVCNDISSEETMKRELKPYILLNDQIQKILVVNKPIPEHRDENGFMVIGVTDFLLRFIK